MKIKIRNILLFSIGAFLIVASLLVFLVLDEKKNNKVQSQIQLGVKQAEAKGKWVDRFSYDFVSRDGIHKTIFYNSPQVFWDGENWQELKSVEKPDFCSEKDCRFFLQNARVALEIYDYYVRFFDPDYDKVSVEKEWFIPQVWDGEWKNIETYNPRFEANINDENVTITRLMDSSYGESRVSYILRKGTLLKHEITFTNLGKKAEFRVLMKLFGIRDNKVGYNGEEYEITGPKETISPYFVVGDIFTERLWSLGFYDQKTGEWVNNNLKNIIFDTDADGIKADIIIGNYTLAKGESLEIDPATDTFYTSAAGDGYIERNDLASPFKKAHVSDATVDTTTSGVLIGQALTGSSYYINRGYFSFDTSSIPDAATIQSATFSLKTEADYSQTDFNTDVYGGTQPIWGDTLEFADWDCGTTSLGTILSSSSYIDETYFNLGIAIAQINKTGKTQFEVKSGRDVDCSAATQREDISWHTSEDGSGNEPKLEVTWTQPNQPPTITSVSDSPDPQEGGSDASFTSVASDPDVGDTIKLYACKDSSCTNCAPGDTTNCWAVTTVGVATDPSTSYTCPSCTVATNSYWAKVCDQDSACSSIITGGGGSFSCKKENGCSETIASNCFSNYAVDGYCCDSACTGTCERCDLTPGTCTVRSADDNTECAACNRCDGSNTTCQAQTGETGYLCTSDCSDCSAGSCVGTTEDNDGSCNLDCDSCVSGSCNTRSADDNTEVSTTCYYCNGSNTTSQPFTGDNGINCNNDCDSCVSGSCNTRSADDNTEVSTTCYYCNGSNTTSQPFTGETGINCTSDCSDCISGTCTGTTENNDGTCNSDCDSCVSGTCTTRAADDNTEVSTTCYYCNGSNTTSQPFTGDNGINCNEGCSQCSAGSCDTRSADDNTECTACNRCNGSNTTCQAQTGETGYLCTSDCSDCISGTCTGTTENNDGTCNSDCDSCVSGSCNTRSADDNTEVSTTCYYCNGSNNNSQPYTGESGVNCTTDCYDCSSGSCTGTTENDDGTCNNDCNSCVSGTCTDRSRCDATECSGQSKCHTTGGDCRQPDVSAAVCNICYYNTKWDSVSKKCCGDDGALEIPWCSVGGGSCLLGAWYNDHCLDKNKNCDEKDIDCGGIDCNVCPEDVLQEEPPEEEPPEEEPPEEEPLEEPKVPAPIVHTFDIIKAPGIIHSFTYEELTEDIVDRTRLIAGRTTIVRYKALNDLKSVFLSWDHKKYDFKKEDSRLFVVDFPTPQLKGDYDLSITFVYPDDTKEIQTIPILVDPLGYIYKTTEAGQQERIKGAKVLLYSFGTKSEIWNIWKADKYGQKNPQITDITGEYAFLVPKGKYYLEVSKEGYQTKETEEFEVTDEPINKNIELRPIPLPSFWQRSWWILVILLIVSGLGIYFWRKRRER